MCADPAFLVAINKGLETSALHWVKTRARAGRIGQKANILVFAIGNTGRTVFLLEDDGKELAVCGLNEGAEFSFVFHNGIGYG